MSNCSASTDDSGNTAKPAAGEVVATLLESSGARAAGLWWVEEGDLVREVFVACAEMPLEVVGAFMVATRSVALSDVSLGIVAAAIAGVPQVSRAQELPPDVGSGRWLRAFGAERSVAVPLVDENGRTFAVLSVAIPSSVLTDDEVAEQVRRAGRSLKP